MSTENSTTTTTDSFDSHIVPAETKARKEREGDDYKHTPDNAKDPDSIHTADGYTVDTEGLVNNYAIEPEMYYEVPGDLGTEEPSVSLEAKAKSIAKNIEGKIEEVVGNLTRNPETQAEGKAKQAEAEALTKG